MTVRVLRSFTSATHGTFQAGDEVELPEGADWVEAGHAEPVSEGVDVEQYHTGQGWYDVPGLEKKVREEEARQHLIDRQQDE